VKNATFKSQTLTADAAGTATQNFDAFAIGGQSIVFFQFSITAVGLTGLVKVQASADGTVWTDIPTVTQNVTATGTVVFNLEHYGAPFVRAVAVASAGSMAVTVKGFAKE